ncbi:hypothetical protein E1161_21630 [Saccharopolyspora aridisoli]|uniref:DUF4071 domain-containing protein n=1 Tax=Saccharopolyspora aridisoli TaxID=2530385 RepID=A0A4R4UR41_9PSEU|nr:hypothetical protein [Saccharopolyspora aridisoli]TDC89299.1 hypothetical protein E1161_21630 [Saccharopolyspora aridisoli]
MEGKECFVVSPIGAPGSDTRRRANQVFKHVVKPVFEYQGYSCTRGDTIEQSGHITTQVLEKILNAQVVVADLTDHNPNVFYELAIRHVTGKPFIQLIAQGQNPPFDIHGFRTIQLDHKDLDSAEEAKKSISQMLEGIENGDPVQTPVNYAINWNQLRKSENAEERGIADLKDQFNLLQHTVRKALNVSAQSDANNAAMVRYIEHLSEGRRMQSSDREILVDDRTSTSHDRWIDNCIGNSDPWHDRHGFSDEPPF